MMQRMKSVFILNFWFFANLGGALHAEINNGGVMNAVNDRGGLKVSCGRTVGPLDHEEKRSDYDQGPRVQSGRPIFRMLEELKRAGGDIPALAPLREPVFNVLKVYSPNNDVRCENALNATMKVIGGSRVPIVGRAIEQGILTSEETDVDPLDSLTHSAIDSMIVGGAIAGVGKLRQSLANAEAYDDYAYQLKKLLNKPEVRGSELLRLEKDYALAKKKIASSSKKTMRVAKGAAVGTAVLGYDLLPSARRRSLDDLTAASSANRSNPTRMVITIEIPLLEGN